MKHTLMRVFATALVVVGLWSVAASADPIKGQKIIDRAIHDDCAMPSSRLAMMHSLSEWDAIYKSGQMEAEVAKLCQRKSEIKPFNAKYSKYVFEYLQHYANDSGAIPA
jgi:hypothetical protein